jgi:hypothetical protein
MNATAAAKRRARARRRQSGAAMFIVAMTLAVLASVGVYALAAAATEIKTSGNERQNTQTHYLAEYGIIGAAHEITATAAKWHLGIMLSANRDVSCVALPNVPPSPPSDPMISACRRLGSTELAALWTASGATVIVPYGGTTPFVPTTPPGSFGPVPMGGDFFVELTDPMPAPRATRYDMNKMCFYQLTVTGTGTTRPVFPNVDPTPQFAAEGVEVQRARLVAGPMPCLH